MECVKPSFQSIASADRLVNFLICGTQKGGTSALAVYLNEHPEISMANVKEVHFFDSEVYFQNKRPDYSQYHSYFRLNESAGMIGEATPIYMYWYNAPRRIWEYNPNMKLIVLLRNPIERAYSHWNMERSRNRDELSFWDAIQNEEKRCREALPYQHRVYSYMDRGFYSEQLRRLWSYFPEDQVHILKTGFLRHQPETALQEVCDFLNVSRFHDVEAKDVHSRPYMSRMGDKEKDYLKTRFEYEILALERFLGWDCTDWLNA